MVGVVRGFIVLRGKWIGVCKLKVTGCGGGQKKSEFWSQGLQMEIVSGGGNYGWGVSLYVGGREITSKVQNAVYLGKN